MNQASLGDFGANRRRFARARGPRSVNVNQIRLSRFLSGSADFIDDYEGIKGYEDFRDHLVIAYARCSGSTGNLLDLTLLPSQIRRFHLNHAMAEERAWRHQALDLETGQTGRARRRSRARRPERPMAVSSRYGRARVLQAAGEILVSALFRTSGESSEMCHQRPTGRCSFCSGASMVRLKGRG